MWVEGVLLSERAHYIVVVVPRLVIVVINSLTTLQIDYTINILTTAVEKLRSMSPLWEMFQEGIDIKSIQWAQH